MGKKKIKQLDIANRLTGVDLQKTVQCLQSPEKANDAHIQFRLGTGLMKNTGMPVTKERIQEAEIWFLKAAEQEHGGAHLSLGILYIGAYPEHHLGAIERNEQKAKEHFRHAAEQDIPEAQYRLAIILEKSPEMLESAVLWLTKASEHSKAPHNGARCRLALMYLKGNSIILQDKARGIEMLETAAQGGYPEALYHLGRVYEKGDGIARDDVRAVTLLEQAAQKKHKDALLHLATKYEVGDGVSKNDTEAMRLLTIGAKAEYPEVQLRLALKYELGQGIPKDNAQAIQLLIKAAEQGYPEAQFHLAIKYEKGDGVEKNGDQALALLTAAAKKGYPEAQFQLGVRYHDGCGIEKDERKAVHWLTKAANGGHPQAMEYLCNLVEKSICLNDIYSDANQLVRASQSVLGEKYDIVKIFRDSLPEGMPELADETFYYYTYKLFSSEENIPPVKQPGIVYLYLKNEKFNYILNSFSSEEVYSGTLDLPEGVNLSSLQDVLERQLIQNQYIEPSYEVRLNIQEQYEKFFRYEKKFEAFLLNIMSILGTQGLCDFIEESDDLNLLKDNIKNTAKNLLGNQQLICKNLVKQFKDSSQMIDILKEAYGTTINLEDFYNMGCYMKQLDKQFEHLPAKKKSFINMFFQHPSTTVAFFDSNSISEASFHAIFFEQYTASRKMLFQTLATYFRKKHPKFHELKNIFIMFEKMALIANMTHEETHLMAMPNLQIQLQEENNIFKMICFQLIQPIFSLLIMEAQLIPLSVIYKNLLEIQKPMLLEAMSDLQKRYPNAENLQELLQNLEGTSDLRAIIGLLIKVIQMIESFILELNASKISQESNRRSSNDSSEHTQSLGSLQCTSEDLLSEQVLASPKANKRKSVTMTELNKGRRKSIMMLSQLTSRMGRKNEGNEGLESAPEHEDQKPSALLSSTDNNSQIFPDDIGLSSSNRSGSDNTSSKENGDNTEEDLTASTPFYIKDRSYSPSGTSALLSQKVTHRRGSTINSTLNHNRSGSQLGDITLSSSKWGGDERHQSAKRNRIQDPKPKKDKSLKAKLPFFSTDNTNTNTNEVKNRLRNSLKPNL